MDEELKKAAYLGLNLVVTKTRFPQEYATMQEVTTTTVTFPSTSRDALTEILRQGAQADAHDGHRSGGAWRWSTN